MKKRKNNWIFKVYIIILTIFFINSIMKVGPDGPENVLRSDLLSGGGIINVQEEQVNVLLVLMRINLIFGFTASIVSCLFLLGKRNFFDIWTLFITTMLPRERKYWGRILDEHSNKPLPFARINIYEDSKSEKIIESAISDLDGRYQLRVNKKISMQDLYMKVFLEGYEIVSKKLRVEYLNKSSRVITEDIYLNSLGKNPNNLSILYKKWYSKLYNFFFFLVMIYPLFNIILGLTFLLIHPATINVLIPTIYLISFLWNLSVFRERTNIRLGKIVDEETKEPLKSTLVTIIGDNGATISAVSNSEGIVKFDIEGGNYKTSIYSENHTPSKQLEGFATLEFTSEGYLKRDIPMKRKGDINLNASDMTNPFSG